MRLINAQILALEAPAAWAKQYKGSRIKEYIEIGKQLDALPVESITPLAVNAIIGNESWTRVSDCDECGNTVDQVVQLGEEPHYESAAACVCLACLKAAVRLAKPVNAAGTSDEGTAK